MTRTLMLRAALMALSMSPLLSRAADAQVCQSEFDISKFHMQKYSDPGLSYAVKSIVKMSLQSSIESAKASGYSQEAAIKATSDQVQASEKAVEQSIQSARDFTSGSVDLEGQIKRGLPADYVCGGNAGRAMCAAQLAEWQAEVARQLLSALKCGW